jgi:hypothetical protein
LALYGLQTASINVRRVKFEHRPKEEVVIDPANVDQTQLDDWQWNNEQFVSEEGEDASITETSNREVPPLRGTKLIRALR